MSPKEKADELVAKFLPLAHKNFTMKDDGELQKAKECALIATREVIDVITSARVETHGDGLNIPHSYPFWRTVEQELIK